MIELWFRDELICEVESVRLGDVVDPSGLGDDWYVVAEIRHEQASDGAVDLVPLRDRTGCRHLVETRSLLHGNEGGNASLGYRRVPNFGGDVLMEIERGEFRFRIRSDCVEVSLGPFGDPESETVLCIHLSHLPSLIAGLVAIRQREGKQTWQKIPKR